MKEDGDRSSVDLAVETRGLRVALGGRPVLQGVTLRIPCGQMVAVIGPNGAGKTTLLRCLLGLQKIDAGEIRLFGRRDLGAVLPRVGYVPQRVALGRNFILSVREFLSVRLPETQHWFWRRHAQIDRILREWSPGMDIEPLLDQPLAHLSGGQLQRVLIAFSLLKKPDLLLLDEPTAGVDAPGEQSFYELIAEIHRRHALTVIMVSHDLSMVFRHASWVCALNGVVCCEGSPEQIMNAESLKQAYGIHVSPYQHHHVH